MIEEEEEEGGGGKSHLANDSEKVMVKNWIYQNGLSV